MCRRRPRRSPTPCHPTLPPGDPPGSFDRYGFRVPSGIVSPYARKDYVSHVVHDHTSILKLIETKWNLPALTHRDAAADDLLDSVDLHADPAFLDAARSWRPPPDPAVLAGCLSTGPGTIPPADVRHDGDDPTACRDRTRRNGREGMLTFLVAFSPS